MKLTSFLIGGCQGFTISNPSPEFKKAHPKTWIACSISRNEVIDIDKLSDLKYGFSEISYLFANRPPTIKEQHDAFYESLYGYGYGSSEQQLKVIPFDGHNYFIGDKDESDFILKIVANDNKIDPRLMNSIVIRNKCSFMKDVDFKKSLNLLLKQTYNNKYLKSVNTTEKWLNAFLKELPFNLNNEPLRFPDVINDHLLQSPLRLDLNKFVIGYCMRTDMKTELMMVKELEQQLLPLNRRITIYENYNKVAERIAEEAKNAKMKYKYIPGMSISIKICDLNKLKMSYTITDFMR